MAEQLKLFFNPTAVKSIADMMHGAWSDFDKASFQRKATKDLGKLELLERAKHIADALNDALPMDKTRALGILVDSLPPVAPVEENHDFSSFIFLPHTVYIREYGAEEFEAGMQANYEITQRFTAEHCVRPFIERYPKKTLALLKKWTKDPSHHVRRLVSEGTRPRLPWSSHLTAFREDPSLVIDLLELLKDDPSLYVRRSVANNLNDIGKDNPDALYTVARDWLKGASEDRSWLVNHALRSAIKRGEKEALAILGYGKKANVEIENVSISPANAKIGDSIKISFSILNPTTDTLNLLVDLRVHFVKSNGSTSPKVFKMNTATLSPGESKVFRKTVSVKQHSTRTHYAGKHSVDAILNGEPVNIGSFKLS